MRLYMMLFVSVCLTLSGCGEEKAENKNEKEGNGNGDPISQPADEGGLALTPDNTQIEFVGVHTDKTKDDRHGHFDKFAGQIAMDENKALTSISVDIETESLTTPIGKLTNHLQNPDFFDVRKYPSATFKSTEIVAGDADGEVKVTGELTLLETTKSITFPAKVGITDTKATLSSEFVIDWTDFGMAYAGSNIEKEVQLKVSFDVSLPAS